jgi:ferrochelatase
VAKLSRIDNWSFAYQSAGKTNEKWLGPDILEALNELSLKGDTDHVLVVPIGFVADHLEISYDIDIEAQLFASARGLNLKRTESLNASSAFINALADVVHERLN